MNDTLSIEDIIHHIKIWGKWKNGSNSRKNYPDKLKASKNESNGFVIFLGVTLHLFLVIITKISINLKICSLAVWAAHKRIRYDYLWYEPISCGLNHAYTDLGIAFVQQGEIENAIECLEKSWKVYPCPHNTTFGLSIRLSKALSQYKEANKRVQEYFAINQLFLGQGHNIVVKRDEKGSGTEVYIRCR